MWMMMRGGRRFRRRLVAFFLRFLARVGLVVILRAASVLVGGIARGGTIVHPARTCRWRNLVLRHIGSRTCARTALDRKRHGRDDTPCRAPAVGAGARLQPGRTERCEHLEGTLA